MFYKKVTTRDAEKATRVSPKPKKETRFTSDSVDESWHSLVRNLQSQGITADIIEENKEFIKDWVRHAKQSEGVAGAAP